MTPGPREHMQTIRRLAKLHGVQTSFVDASGERRQASLESLARVLDVLGSPASTGAQAARSEEARLATLAADRLDRVTVAWEGRRTSVELRLARPGSTTSRGTSGTIVCRLVLETGERIEWSADARKLGTKRRPGPDGRGQHFVRIPLPRTLPTGYHRLTVLCQGETLESLLVCAPVRAYRHPAIGREWGLFCPIYALRPADASRDWGCGGLSELGELSRWGESLGGRVVATLPLLPAHFIEPFDPSPYAPVSREFWNTLFADVWRAPELPSCPAARRLIESPEFRKEAASLRALKLIDYRRAAALKRRVIELLAEQFFGSGGEKSEGFRAFLSAQPRALEYARFRAATEQQGKAWEEWPTRLSRGGLREGDFDPRAYRYHLYGQYLVSRQMQELSRDLKERGAVVYLDLPVGTSPYGFDVWRNQALFAMGCATGAPPDPYFTGGQNWGFPPMHPDEARREGYATFIAALRHHMKLADYLRLDHVMAFHRLFWIPDGMDASGGVYVKYHAEDFYAILCLESHRNRCRLVGENLGTVPPEVNKALAKHDLCGLYVAQYEMQPAPKTALRPVPANCVASVNTHDMPPFATCWSAGDVDDRIGLDMLAPEARERELATRAKMREAMVRLFTKRGAIGSTAPDRAGVREVRDALLDYLAQSPADFLLVNIEDLWLETHWQNVPGTMDEHPNWRRRLRFDLAEIAADKSIESLLRRIADGRRAGTGEPGRRRGADVRTRSAGAGGSGKPRRERHAIGQGV